MRDRAEVEGISDEYYEGNSEDTLGLPRLYNFYLEDMSRNDFIDISPQATFRVSSYKQGHGIECLRDEQPDTYWQSDGQQPHTLDISFSKHVSLQCVAIFVDYQRDESYTPSHITVSAGTCEYDLIDAADFQLENPSGWVSLDLTKARFDKCLKCFCLRLSIRSNHQNGKDTHIRSIKIYTKRPALSTMGLR